MNNRKNIFFGASGPSVDFWSAKPVAQNDGVFGIGSPLSPSLYSSLESWKDEDTFMLDEQEILLNELEAFGHCEGQGTLPLDNDPIISSPDASPVWTFESSSSSRYNGMALEESTIDLEAFTANALTPPDSPNSNYNTEFQSILESLQEESSSSCSSGSSNLEEECMEIEHSATLPPISLSQKILDAILEGNVSRAEQLYIPLVGGAVATVLPLEVVLPTTSEVFSERKQSTSQKVKKPRLPARTDRVARKKEQNKTAATRYREKKKLEACHIGEVQVELNQDREFLEKKKEDLAREITIVKGLLRDIIKSKRLSSRKLMG